MFFLQIYERLLGETDAVSVHTRLCLFNAVAWAAKQMFDKYVAHRQPCFFSVLNDTYFLDKGEVRDGAVADRTTECDEHEGLAHPAHRS